jgi:N,N-dimethylformamidase
VIGDFGVGGGAAGQEVDRFDTALGSPAHALVLASATDFSEQMLRTKEEFHATVIPARPDPLVRADIVFFETAAGGAVFSVGSIAWWGALVEASADGRDNQVARITANVVRRFADPAPFKMPG